MDLSAYLSSAAKQAEFSREIGAHAPDVSRWASGTRRVPQDRCPDIENATEGRVTCEELRPDVCWVRVPDAAWPHPSGRPCIDVATPDKAAA